MAYLLEASVLLALLYAVYHLGLRRDTFARRNRVYLVVGLPLTLVLAAAHWPALPLVADALAPDRLLAPLRVEATPRAAAGANWLGLVYLAGVVLRLGHSGWSLYQVLALVHRYVPERYRGVWLIRTRAMPTASFGPYLIWHPAPDLEGPARERLLRHELAHIRQGHTYDVLLAEVFCAIFWFHPIVYLWQRELRTVHEFLADAEAAHTHERPAYLRQLAGAYLQAAGLAPVTGFRSRQLHRRLAQLRRLPSPRWAQAKWLLAAPVVVVGLGVGAPPLAQSLQRPALTSADFAEGYRSARPVGGWSAFYAAYQTALAQALPSNVGPTEGQFEVVFLISPDGSLGWVAVTNAPNAGVARAASTALLELPQRWAPALRGGVPTSQRFTMPIALD